MYKVLTLIFISLSTISCGDNNDRSLSSAEFMQKISGKWSVTCRLIFPDGAYHDQLLTISPTQILNVGKGKGGDEGCPTETSFDVSYSNTSYIISVTPETTPEGLDAFLITYMFEGDSERIGKNLYYEDGGFLYTANFGYDPDDYALDLSSPYSRVSE